MFTITISADSAEALATQAAELAAQLSGSGSADDAPAEKPKATRGKAAKPAAKADEVEDAQIVEETKPEPKKETPALTMADVRAKLGELIALGGEGSKASIEIVSALGAKDEKGLPKASEIKPDQFAKCVEMVEAKLKDLTPTGVL